MRFLELVQELEERHVTLRLNREQTQVTLVWHFPDATEERVNVLAKAVHYYRVAIFEMLIQRRVAQYKDTSKILPMILSQKGDDPDAR